MSEVRGRVPLLGLAWRNARRHGRRTLLSASAIAVAVAASIVGLALAGGMLGTLLDSFARLETGHVRVRAAGYGEREAFLPVHLNVSSVERRVAALRAVDGVKAVLPRIRASVLVDGAESNRPALLLGVDIEAERGYLDPAAITGSGITPRPGEAEALLGVGLARRLGVEVGDTIVLLGQTAYRSLGGIRLVVGGLAESGIPSWDDIVTVLPLDQAQRLLDLSDGATEIVVLLRDPDHAAAAIEPIRAALGPTDALEVRTWLEQGPLIRTLQSARGGYSVVFLLLMGMAGLVIVNTMLMTVMERAQEHGVQSALGMRKRDLLRLIVTEGAVIGALGAVAGAVAGTVVAVTLGRIGIDASQAARTVAAPFQGVIHPVWSWWHSMLGVVVGVATAALATLYPAWRLRRLRPAEALRS